MKKYVIGTLILLAIIISGLFFAAKNTMCFIYLNKDTNTQGLSYISNPIKYLEKGFEYAQKESKADALEFSYTFLNAYGSGFVSNNPIPNDLDFAIGVHLGKYAYDGSNSIDIAKGLMDKINSFLYFFNIYVNENETSHYYIADMPLETLNNNVALFPAHVKAITENLDNALSGKEYMVHSTSSIQDDQGKEIAFDIPYIMNPHEILIKKFNPIKIYSDKVRYSKDMIPYLREISIVPEFSFEITYKDKDYRIELIPEAFTGERLHLARRFFAPNVFVSPVSDKYLTNLDILNNEESYVRHRLLSFRRHLQEILNISYVKNKPIKMFKRIAQAAYIMAPMLSDEEKEFVSNVTQKYLYDRNIQLMNEYSNICSNILYILQENPRMSERIAKDGHYQRMKNDLNGIIEELDQINKVKKETIAVLKGFVENDLRFLSEMSSREDFAKLNQAQIVEHFGKVSPIISKEIFALTNEEEIKTSVQYFKNIYKKAGFAQVTLFWLDSENIGILKNSYTSKIKDLNEFAKANNLPNAKYKFIKESQIPRACIKYGAWVRNNTTKEEDEYYKKLLNILNNEREKLKFEHKLTIIRR